MPTKTDRLATSATMATLASSTMVSSDPTRIPLSRDSTIAACALLLWDSSFDNTLETTTDRLASSATMASSASSASSATMATSATMTSSLDLSLAPDTLSTDPRRIPLSSGSTTAAYTL